MRNSDPVGFEQDKRHFLYKEYLRIIQKFRPAVFVMENVKGMLSSTHNGSLIFQKIREDLSEPCAGLSYQIRSFVTGASNLKPTDFIIEAEHYGIPQRRHRVILLGVRSDLRERTHDLLTPHPSMTSVGEALSGMPRVRSRLSREPDSFENWIDALREAPRLLKYRRSKMNNEVHDLMNEAIQQAAYIGDNSSISSNQNMPKKLSEQLLDVRMTTLYQHEPRSHMREDLHRYLFASCYTEIAGISPKLDKYPTNLWPLHKNLDANEVPFDDRFRVQCLKQPSTTVVSHIAKDGHF
jgi:DNA (cytosine-5)-methyltransferase 1